MKNISGPMGSTTVKDFPYYRALWNRVIVAILAAAFLPLLLIGGSMYFCTMSELRKKTMESVRTEVVHHKDAIDRFLAERLNDLRLLSANLNPVTFTTPEPLESVFHSLLKELPYFTDLGIIDAEGRHLVYAGPYDLISKNYKQAEWFKSVMERGVYVSDVFLGFRKVPHFVIALKRGGKTGPWILRATVDATYFDRIVSGSGVSGGTDAFLINRHGVFQSKPRTGNRLMSQSEFRGIAPFEGVKIEKHEGEFCAMAWLDRAPWLCVVKIDSRTVLKPIHRVRNIGILVFILGSILVVVTVLLTTNYLITLLESKRQRIQVLGERFYRTGHLLSLLELFPSLVREMGDILSNIDVAAAWIDEAAKKEDLREIRHTMAQIRSEMTRGRKFVERFTSFLKPSFPIASELDVNGLLKEVLEILDRELRFRNIKVRLAYQSQLPSVTSDRTKLGQVILHILLNAMDAIEKDGEIRIETRTEKDGVMVSVSDNGPGIPEDAVEYIFDAFFTTRTGHLGLGLTICAEIMEKLGGRISVGSTEGKGACFTILIPFKVQPSGTR